MTQDFYRDLASDYDRMIRWEKRLAFERPLFESWIRRYGVRSLLDASCGSGHHLVLFDSMGVDVVGADASEAMIELSREQLRKAGLSEEGRLYCAIWEALPDAVSRTFDAVLCIGNSLPYVRDPDVLKRSLQGLWSRVSKGGLLLIQFKNFRKLQRDQQRLLPLSWVDTPEETIALRVYDYHSDRIDFNVMLLNRKGSEWTVRHHTTPLQPYTSEDIEPLLRDLGATVSLHGTVGLAPFDVNTSDDLVLMAKREI